MPLSRKSRRSHCADPAQSDMSTQVGTAFTDERKKHLLSISVQLTLIFFLSYLILFFAMSLRPGIYDEGIALTESMRVMAGKIPHRDFYFSYGPAQLYILAALFKLFGTSILVERLYGLFIESLLITSVYAIASVYCRRSIALCASLVTLFWLLALLTDAGGSTTIPLSLINLIGIFLVLPLFLRNVSRWRLLVVGATAGLATLFRYDTGIALLGIDACIIAVAVYLRISGTSNRLRAFGSAFWPCLLGFVSLTLPPAIYYFSVAPLHPLIYDIFLFPSKYYYRGRALPFPPVTLKQIDNSTIYSILVICVIAIYVLLRQHFLARSGDRPNHQETPKQRSWQGFLIAFTLLTLAMYFKGFVRISLIQLYLSIIPALLVLAILFEHKAEFVPAIRVSIVCLAALFVFSAAWCSLRKMRDMYVQHSSLLGEVLSPPGKMLSPLEMNWCKIANPLTRGICFLPDDDHIQTIEFIDAHTQPGQPLFVGLTRHDKIYANDNLIYFATQRLPATGWSQFEPDLQNQYGIQVEMVHELKTNIPPYIVRDSEFDQSHEPNDSDKSSGVTLLDDFLRNQYQQVQAFGSLSIWQLRNTGS